MNIKTFQGSFSSPIDLFHSIINKSCPEYDGDFKLFQKYDKLRFVAKNRELNLDLRQILKDFEFPITVQMGCILDYVDREELVKFVGLVRKIREQTDSNGDAKKDKEYKTSDEEESKSKVESSSNVVQQQAISQQQQRLQQQESRQQNPVIEQEPLRRMPLQDEFPPEFPGYSNPIGNYPNTGVGSYDLDPFAGSRGFVGTGGGGMPYGGGMIVGPDHPMFNNPGSSMPGMGRGGLRFPTGAVPPGARFDPVNPFDPMGPATRGRGQRPPFSGDPDNDEFMPPGM